MAEPTARGIGLDFGGGECRVMAVEGSEYQLLATVPLDPLLSRREPPGDGCPWRRESIKRYTGMEKVVDVHGYERRTDDVLTEYLRLLKEQSEGRLKAAIHGVTISAPPCFTDRQKAATKRCAEAAGWGSVALVDDSQAAALDYAVRSKQRGKWLVYGLGRSVFFVTVLDSTQPKHHNGSVRLGGDDFDGLIADELVRRGLVGRGGLAPGDWRLGERLIEAAERCKRLLSAREEVESEAFWPAAGRGLPFSFAREEFERLIAGQIDETLRLAEQTVTEDGLGLADLDRILLIGGSTKIPLVRRRLEGLRPDGVIDLPGDAVARGAALYATTLVGVCFKREARAPMEPAGMPPKLVEAWRKVQQAYEENALDDVITYYRQFIDAAREDLSGMYQRRAGQLAQAGKEEEAVDFLKKGHECWPANSAIAKRLAEHYLRSAASYLEAAHKARNRRDLSHCFEFCDRAIRKSLEYDPSNARAAQLREQLKIAKRATR